MNACKFTGRFTANPELKTTQSGITVCSFSLAIKRPKVKDTTDFINFVAWRGTAEFISKYFKKGDPIEVSGALQSRQYEDKDGNKRVAFEVVVDDAQFCLTRANGNGDQSEPEPKENLKPVADDSDLPF